MSYKRFNSLGIKDIDLTNWHNEVICHSAAFHKINGGIDLYAEFRVTLYDDVSGKSYTAVIEAKLEEQ